MVRLALIGAGGHCSINHAPAMQQYAADHPEELELAAVCDLDAEKANRFKEKFGFKAAYTDLNEMLDREKPDGCVCVMPVKLIAGLATDLMTRGMPVTVEKPPGATVEEARELSKTAEKLGAPQMVSVNRRFQPLIQKAKAWALEQGPLRAVRVAQLRHNRREPGFIFGTGIHCLDAIRELAGDVAEVQAERHADGEAEWFHVTFRFTSGAIGSLDVFPTDGSVLERYELFGDGYRVELDAEASPENRLRFWKENKVVLDEAPPEGQPDFVRLGPYNETKEFVTALAEGRRPWPEVKDVLPSLELAAKVQELTQAAVSE